MRQKHIPDGSQSSLFDSFMYLSRATGSNPSKKSHPGAQKFKRRCQSAEVTPQAAAALARDEVASSEVRLAVPILLERQRSALQTLD